MPVGINKFYQFVMTRRQDFYILYQFSNEKDPGDNDICALFSGLFAV